MVTMIKDNILEEKEEAWDASEVYNITDVGDEITSLEERAGSRIFWARNGTYR